MWIQRWRRARTLHPPLRDPSPTRVVPWPAPHTAALSLSTCSRPWVFALPGSRPELGGAGARGREQAGSATTAGTGGNCGANCRKAGRAAGRAPPKGAAPPSRDGVAGPSPPRSRRASGGRYDAARDPACPAQAHRRRSACGQFGSVPRRDIGQHAGAAASRGRAGHHGPNHWPWHPSGTRRGCPTRGSARHIRSRRASRPSRLERRLR